MSVESQIADAMARNWRVFKKHHPVGAYLPVGQFDGDCRECHEEWPCAAVRAVIAPLPPARKVDLGSPAHPSTMIGRTES